MKNIVIGTVMAAVIVTITGCASNKYATKDDVAKVAVTADKAQITANKALATANSNAEQISQLREVTATGLAENRARLDALFEKAMRK